MAKNGKSKNRKASYEGYCQILIDESTIRSAYSAMNDDFNLWAWIDKMRTSGYEFSFETEADTEYAMCVMKSIDPANSDAGLYLFTTAYNTMDAVILTWYKFVYLNGGQPLAKSTPKERSPFR